MVDSAGVAGSGVCVAAAGRDCQIGRYALVDIDMYGDQYCFVWHTRLCGGPEGER